jgi:AcrR family transcriptional regulator
MPWRSTALAAALGVKPPSLYAHVSSLQELKSGIAILGLKELEIELARSSVGKSGPDAVRALCWAYRRYAKRRPGVYLATVLWTPQNDPAVHAAGRALKGTVLKILPQSNTRTKFAEQIHLLRILRISLHGFVALKMASAFGEPVDP